jgi:hypothetical protein
MLRLLHGVECYEERKKEEGKEKLLSLVSGNVFKGF